MKTFTAPQCGICGELLVAQNFAGQLQGEQLCGLCQRFRPSYARAAAYGPYEGVLRDLIHLLKYKRVRSAAKALGLKLADVLRMVVPEAGSGAIIVPVPLYKSKRNQRGFNQAQSVAGYAFHALKSQLAADYEFFFEPEVLRRKRETVSQTGLTRHQRRENVRGAFAVNPTLRRFIASKNIILVDDVFTTGTTAEECSRVLLRAGAAKVWVATIARVSKLEAMAVHPIQEGAELAVAAGNAARA